MDENIRWFYTRQAERVIRALGPRGINAELVEAAQLARRVLELVPKGAVVGMGGSMTLVQTGVLKALREAEVELLDRFREGLSEQEKAELYRRALTADVFISGVNAITVDGELVFVDAYGNRVAPILFGPSRVILLAGCNKIVPDIHAAHQRIRFFVAPTNARRLGRKSPCTTTGRCEDCASPDRICNYTVVIHRQAVKQRMHLFLVPEELGL